MSRHQITLRVNGVAHHLEVAGHHTLLHTLRQQLGLTGTKHGCTSGQCGACTLLVNDQPLPACLILAVEVDQADILTVEGLATAERLHPLQKAFLDHQGVQCGYCAPGMLLAAAALLQHASRPDEAAIRAALAGNLCKCASYADIIRSVQTGARARR